MVDAMKTSVEFLELSLRAANVLRRMKISHVGQLLEYSASDLLKWKNCGHRTVAEIQRELLKLGFRLCRTDLSPKHDEKTKILQQIREMKERIAALRAQMREIEAAEAKERMLQKQTGVPDALALDVARMRADGTSYGKIAEKFNVSAEWARVKHLQTVRYLDSASSATGRSCEEIAASLGLPVKVLDRLAAQDHPLADARKTRSSRRGPGRSSGEGECGRCEESGRGKAA